MVSDKIMKFCCQLLIIISKGEQILRSAKTSGNKYIVGETTIRAGSSRWRINMTTNNFHQSERISDGKCKIEVVVGNLPVSNDPSPAIRLCRIPQFHS